MTANNQLEAWLALEREVRARYDRGPGPGVISAEQLAGKTGMEVISGQLNGVLPYACIAHTLDFLLIEVDHGRVVFQGKPGPAHLNPLGGIHGGWYATLLDSALACAVQTMLPVGRSYTTTELSLNIVRAIGPDVQRVRAEGKVLHFGRQLATSEARLYGPDGKLFAHGTTTCMMFELGAGRGSKHTAQSGA